MKIKLTNVIVVVTCCCCVSCNTMVGMGKDFQKLGNGLQKVGQPRTWRTPGQTSSYDSNDYGVPDLPPN
jgi:predicted small secreted protein